MSRPVGALGLAVLLVLGCGGGKTHLPSRSERDNMHVLRLVGTPYEMGVQHGQLMAAELTQGVAFVENDPSFSMLLSLAKSEGYIDDAMNNSYPDVLDECRGMEEGAKHAGVVGWDVDKCITLAYGDTIIEHLSKQIGGGCSQFMATGAATPDGSLVHGRSLDWGNLSYLIEHPTIIVRRPTGQIPYAVIGFPGCVAPYSGMNDQGLSIASDEATALDDIDRTGRSHVQMIREILQQCSSLEEAEAFLKAQDHTTAEILMVSDGRHHQAAVFEMTANHTGIRRLSDAGVVYMTNHFLSPEMAGLDEPTGPDTSTRSRFVRLAELLEPGGSDSLHGHLDTAGAISVLRDTFNPVTQVSNPKDLFDGGGSIANNANLHCIVFVPAKRAFYTALGEPPVPQRPFLGFSLDELFENTDRGTDPERYQ